MTNTEREKFLIGKVLINPELFIKDEDRLMKIKLNEPNYSFLWEAIKKVHKSGTKIDMVTIGKEIGMDKNSLSVLFDCESYGYTNFDFNSLIEDLSYRSKYQTMGNLLLNINNLMQKNEPLDTISDELKKGIEIIQTDESANDENIGGQLKDYYTLVSLSQ